jgi:hypothetical protein
VVAQSDANSGGEHSPADVQPEQDREVTLAALAGTAVDRLFLGGPLDGEVHERALFQWLAKRWLAEAPERGPQ